MTVNEINQALGSWELRLRKDTPKNVLDALTFFGHVVLVPGRLNPSQYNDQLLPIARYVGVYRGRSADDDFILKGVGMSFWLGDEDNKGDVFETAVTLTAQTFASSVAALLPASGAVTAGTINSIAGTYTGVHQYQTPKQAITYVTDTFGAEWRVTGDGKLDAGTVAQLYVTNPKAIITRRADGRDLRIAAFSGSTKFDQDVEDYTVRVILLGEGEGGSVATGSASQATSYKDIHGNTLKMTRLVSESDTSDVNADTRAQLALNAFSGSRKAVSLTTDAYDVKGDFVVGDYVNVYDPDNGFIDPSREVYWEGQNLNPISLRCVEMSWPISPGWTVLFRDSNGAYIDLSPYYAGETGQTSITVGDLNSSLSGLGSEPVDSRVQPDTSIPAAPAFVLPFYTGVYQQATARDIQLAKAVIQATWTTPLNIDGSTVLDGDHYEIRYRVSAVIGYQVDWDLLASGYNWDSLGTWDGLVSSPITLSPQWSTALMAWGTNNATLTELTPGITYELQIRAVDAATPPNFSPWSASSFVTTLGDIIAPSQPAAPVVAGSRISIQVVHQLGKSSGGTFNLEPDLDHLDVHVGGSSSFFPDSSNRVGKLIATAGMLQSKTSAVGTFPVEQTDGIYVKVIAVDGAGNRSSGSPAAQVTALLIDSAHISDLTASKITAGTINTGTIDVASQIRVATGGTVDVTNGQFRVLDTSGNVILRAGVISGRTCLEVLDAGGSVKNRMGELTDGSYGVESEDNNGNLVSLETLAFGIQAAQVNSQETTTSDTYVDLSTYGPEVRVTIGASSRCIVFLSAEIYSGQTGSIPAATGGFMSFQVTDADTGAVAVSTGDGNALKFSLDKNNQSAGETVTGSIRVGCSVFLTAASGLYPGEFYFTAKYRRFSATGGDAQFDRRGIVVFPY